jgi:hypothetical protein
MPLALAAATHLDLRHDLRADGAEDAQHRERRERRWLG